MRGFALMATIGSLSVALTGTVSAGQTSDWKQMSDIDRTRAERQNASPRDQTDQNYPNPLQAATGFKTTIPFTTTAEGIAAIRIVNLLGATVYRDVRDESSMAPSDESLDLSALPSGQYVLRLLSAGRTLSTMLVIQK